MGDNNEISGLLYKKRGGFGKMMPNAWQFRYFSISKDGVLCYFDTDKPDIGLTEIKARGKLDLKSNYDLILDQTVEGSPTIYSIQVCPPGEEKWKLCAESKEDYTRWCLILERFLHDKPTRTALSNPASYASDDEAEHKRRTVEISCRSADSSEFSPTSSPTNKNTTQREAVSTSASNVTYAKQTPVTTHVPAVKTISSSAAATGNKKRLKLGNKAEMISGETLELAMVLLILNICIYGIYTAPTHLLLRKVLCVAVANVVVAHTLQLRAARVVSAVATAAALTSNANEVNASGANSLRVHGADAKVTPAEGVLSVGGSSQHVLTSQQSISEVAVVKSGKPTPGFTFTEVQTEPRLSAPHTWCRVDHRQFNVRVGPEYSRYKKKAPSGPPIYEPFAVDVFCTKLRVDHAGTRFQLPDTSHINTHNEFVPPIVIVQIQIPSEPPTSIFSSAEDGPGWAIVMYYRISEDACNQLKDMNTASPAVKLFAEWCEKAPVDAAWRGRFKVINSCTNLEELGMPSAIVAYNAKPVLIRRTGTIFRGPNYLEMNIHVHKFANLAKQSIYLISSRCGLMFMQIGFVIEGRDDKELPEAMFACVAVNKPQEDQAEFIFEEEEE